MLIPLIALKRGDVYAAIAVMAVVMSDRARGMDEPAARLGPGHIIAVDIGEADARFLPDIDMPRTPRG